MGLLRSYDFVARRQHRSTRGPERRRGVSRAFGSSPTEPCFNSSSPKKKWVGESRSRMVFVDNSHINDVHHQRHVEPTTGQETNSNRIYLYLSANNDRRWSSWGIRVCLDVRMAGKTSVDRQISMAVVSTRKRCIYILIPKITLVSRYQTYRGHCSYVR